jgi:hypothetical protein
MQLEGAVLEHMDLGIRQMHHAVGCRAEIIDESNAAAIERVAETALAQYPGEVGWSRLATDDRAGHPEACGCDWIFVGADEISANIFEAFETAGVIEVLVKQRWRAMLDAKQSQMSFGAADVAG